jgi:hypothetical protein
MARGVTVGDIWSGLDAAARALIVSELIGASATIGAAIIGVLVVFWQIGRQARFAISQQQHTERLKLKLDVYRELLRLCEAARHSIIQAHNFTGSFTQQLESYEAVATQGVVGIVPKSRATDFIEVWKKASDAVLDLIAWTEKWEIIDPRIEVFRTAFNATLHDNREEFAAYVDIASITMPRDQVGPTGQLTLFPWQPPTGDDREKLFSATARLRESLFDLGSYVEDLQKDMQNLLVGELFGRRLRPRLPLDPEVVVVTLDRFDFLMKHFDENTAWGQLKAEYEEKWEESRRQGGENSVEIEFDRAIGRCVD